RTAACSSSSRGREGGRRSGPRGWGPAGVAADEGDEPLLVGRARRERLLLAELTRLADHLLHGGHPREQRLHLPIERAVHSSTGVGASQSRVPWTRSVKRPAAARYLAAGVTPSAGGVLTPPPRGGRRATRSPRG